MAANACYQLVHVNVGQVECEVRFFGQVGLRVQLFFDRVCVVNDRSDIF